MIKVPTFCKVVLCILILILEVQAHCSQAIAHDEIDSSDSDDVVVDDQVWVCVLDLEKNASRRLFAVPGIAIAGSPSVSADERQIAFDGSAPGLNSTSQANLFLAEIDGKDLRNLGRAAMPSWSPDGNRLIISQYGFAGADGGVWNLKADATDATLIDAAGWSGQWSPDGRKVVYLKGRDLILYDIMDNSRRSLLGESSELFSRVNFNPAWSADNQRVYFKAQRKDGTYEICSCSVSDKTDLQVHIQRPTYANIGIAFDGRIIVPFRSKSYGTVQLHAFPQSGKGPATDSDAVHVKGQFTKRNSYGASMSRDQKRVYYISTPASEEEVKAGPSK